MANVNTPQIICHQVTSAHQNLEIFDKLLDLSRTVFEPNTPPQDLPTHFQRSKWEEQLALPNAKIFYATDTSSNTLDQPIGFFFVLPRTQPEIGYELLHIRLVAVDEKARGLGVFPLLMERALDHARLCGYREVTICTFPARFEKMYRILNAHGWKLVAWPVENEKVLMKMEL